MFSCLGCRLAVTELVRGGELWRYCKSNGPVVCERRLLDIVTLLYYYVHA